MRIGSVVILLLFSLWAQAQIAYIYTDKDSILVGDKLDVKLTLSGFSPADVKSVNWDTLSNLEFVNYADTANYPIDFDWSPKQESGDDFIYEGTDLQWKTEESSPGELSLSFEMTIWEMCGFIIPPPIVTLYNGDTIQVNSRGVIVKSPLYDQYELKEAPSFGVLVENKSVWDYIVEFWWLIAFLIAVAIAFFIRHKLKNRPRPEVLPPPLPVRKVVVVPPDIVALKKLNTLKENRTWESVGEKEYVSELTEIIREYIENRFEVKALEMTSGEILAAMQGDLLDGIQMEQLSNTLNVADMIKFAKSKADASLHEKFVDDAIDMVESSKEKPVQDGE